MTTIAYEIAAVFLLAALLMMYGRVSALLPRSLRGAIPILFVVALLGFAIYGFWPDLYAALWSAAGDGLSPAAARPASTPGPKGSKSSPPNAKAEKPSTPHWKTTVVDDSVPQSTRSGPASVRTVEDADGLPGAPAASGPEEKSSTADSGGSPSGGKAKRTIQSIGHLLHIGRPKASADASGN